MGKHVLDCQQDIWAEIGRRNKLIALAKSMNEEAINKLLDNFLIEASEALQSDFEVGDFEVYEGVEFECLEKCCELGCRWEFVDEQEAIAVLVARERAEQRKVDQEEMIVRDLITRDEEEVQATISEPLHWTHRFSEPHSERLGFGFGFGHLR